MPSVNSAKAELTDLLDPQEGHVILVVEDEAISMAFMKAQISALGHEMIAAENGQIALEKLEQLKGRVDVVLMDREMPVMDGLSAVRRMKDNPVLRNIPVIMVTGADTLEEMKEGIDAGVFYYLTKPVKEDMLQSVLAAAVNEAQQHRTLAMELGKHRTSFNLIETCRFRYTTLEEAESLAAFMANCFPDPTRVLAGLAELMINAIEHGNLEIGYDKKTELIDHNTWRAEVERRLQLPNYEDRSVEATIVHKADGTYAVIEDMGRGFAWKNFLQIDPARAGDNHGRGIALANATSFDKLSYNEQGNKVVAFVSNAPQLDW